MSSTATPKRSSETNSRRRSSIDHYYSISDIVCDCGKPCTIAAHNGDDSVTRRGRKTLRRHERPLFVREKSDSLPPYRRQSALPSEDYESHPLKKVKTDDATPQYVRRSSLFDTLGSASNITGAPCESRREMGIRYGPLDYLNDDNDDHGPLSPSEELEPEFGAVNWNGDSGKANILDRLSSNIPPDSQISDEGIAVPQLIMESSQDAGQEPRTPVILPSERASCLSLESLVLPLNESSKGPDDVPQSEGYDGDVSSDAEG